MPLHLKLVTPLPPIPPEPGCNSSDDKLNKWKYCLCRDFNVSYIYSNQFLEGVTDGTKRIASLGLMYVICYLFISYHVIITNIMT